MADDNPGKAMRSTPLSRRRFVGGLGGLAAAAIVPRHILGGARFTPPSERINVAVIGTGGRGKNLLLGRGLNTGFLQHDDAQVIAIADVNERADYSRFYYRGTSGRLPVLEIIKEHYTQKLADGFGGCRDYVDYREMLETESAIDAVVVATPDHVHAVATLAAIRLGKHVYCEKPLTHTVEEARKVTEEARKAGVATQMGNQGNSGEGIRQACEWIWSGAIGEVREVHAWSNTGGWSSEFNGRPSETPPVPEGLDWDLWLGPVEHRPYHPAYAPYNWRGWWAFGTGAVGDMGCHNMDPAFAALKLKYPETIEASSTSLNPETVPHATLIHYTFGAREGMPPVRLHWYDCGLFPPRPEEFAPGQRFDNNGILFVGAKGKLLMDGWGNNPRLIPEERMREFKEPAKTLPRVESHDRAWLDAIKGGPAASSSFEHGGPLTEAVLLGNVALRSGEKLAWDGEAMRATNCPKAEEFIRVPYRKGWTL